MKKVSKKVSKKVAKKKVAKKKLSKKAELVYMNQRAKDYYWSQRDRGLARVGVWIHPDDAKALHAYAKKKIKARKL